MTHEEKARRIVLDWAFHLSDIAKEILIEEISKALQDAFDLGYRAAGGSVHKIDGLAQ